MARELFDLVSEVVIPWLVHFSEKGITPKIKSADFFGALTIEEVEGPRLGEYLRQDVDAEQLQEIYNELGSRVAYISKYCIVHGHLHTENVVVRSGDNMPVIIDWGMASYLGLIFEDEDRLSQDRNSNDLLEATKERLEEVGRDNIYQRLKDSYAESFRKEINSPFDITPREIQLNSLQKYGI
ncbi:phosphotransferase [Candidatus Woesearchaeota archaeon]|nr:phosphotransferase [Candidatus Woesearchaeota archaeon]